MAGNWAKLFNRGESLRRTCTVIEISIKGWRSTRITLACLLLITINVAVAANEVFLDCPATVQPGTSDSIAMRVYITNDIALNGFTMGYVCPSNGIEFSSVQAGPTLSNPYLPGTLTWRVFPTTKQLAIGWWNYLPQLPIPANSTRIHLVTIWLRATQVYAGECVNIDSCYVTGGCFWQFVYQNGMARVYPTFNDCDLCEIAANPFTCGDANGSGRIDITDAVWMVNYIFGGGPAPLDTAAGDFNCSDRTDITDVVYFVNYVFAGGAPPCAACQ